mmetsp:Transcript_54503/g.63713  ORF Transcript_54503/g.63713 Transcript_54503/m.63713 type:complete len:90 (+) Transcript_54503:117-386(+)
MSLGCLFWVFVRKKRKCKKVELSWVVMKEKRIICFFKTISSELKLNESQVKRIRNREDNYDTKESGKISDESKTTSELFDTYIHSQVNQ